MAHWGFWVPLKKNTLQAHASNPADVSPEQKAHFSSDICHISLPFSHKLELLVFKSQGFRQPDISETHSYMAICSLGRGFDLTYRIISELYGVWTFSLLGDSWSVEPSLDKFLLFLSLIDNKLNKFYRFHFAHFSLYTSTNSSWTTRLWTNVNIKENNYE